MAGDSPEDKVSIYIPAVDYVVFPDAADGQADVIRDVTAEAIILVWYDKEANLVLTDGARNDDVAAGLTKHYNRVFESGDIDLYIWNNRFETV